ncbi:MAG TPA: thiaminase II [Candidatus Binataceae bacterium]|nr:thiaminase II [Candidatus Binataceae bacterium]
MSGPVFSDRLRASVAPIWQKEVDHPFVRGLADGSLPMSRFRFYLCQDYVFLIEYGQIFALAAAKARELAQIEVFSSLLHDTINVEMELHRGYCARLGISRDQLERTEPALITHAYTRHLLTLAWSGSLDEIVAAVLPCQLGYVEIASALGRRPDWQSSPYAEWIRTYLADEFVASAARLRAMLDELAAGQRPERLDLLERHFVTSSRYEYLFWEMAWNESGWPV